MTTRHAPNPRRKGRKPSTAYLEFKSLPVDSQALGFYHPSVADVKKNGDFTAGELHRYAKVRKLVIDGVHRKVGEVN